MTNRVFVPELTTPPRAPNGAPFQVAGASMGTTWSVRGFADIDRAALQLAVADTLHDIVCEMSQWEPGSDLSRFNALPTGASAQAPPAFAEVLVCALAVSAQTAGAFDPTLGALVDLWGFGPRQVTRAPSAGDIDDALGAAGWRKLSFDAATRRLAQPGGLRLDLAGVAKGYAVDRVAALLRERGVESFLVEIGGEMRGCGVKPDGQPWWVQIERPPDAGGASIVAALYELSIATSGDYRRAGILDGQCVSHTIDPRTGRPLITPILSVSVLHADCMWADAYATALTVMGAEAGLAFADKNGLAAMFVVRDAPDAFSRTFEDQLS